MTTSIEVRNDLRVNVAFTDEDGAPVDPDVVSLEITPPSASPAMTTYTYGVGAEIERTGDGTYTALVYVDIEGTWSCCWLCSGAVRGAKTICFDATVGCSEEG